MALCDGRMGVCVRVSVCLDSAASGGLCASAGWNYQQLRAELKSNPEIRFVHSNDAPIMPQYQKFLIQGLLDFYGTGVEVGHVFFAEVGHVFSAAAA